MHSQPPQPLRDQTVLITGAARRLGAVMARHLHAAGANVVIHHRQSAPDAHRLADELNALRPSSAVTVCADLLDVASLPNLIHTAVNTFGRLDVLINNASTFYPTPVGDITPSAFDDLIGTNLRAPLFLSQAAAPELRKRQGLILNLIDIHAFRPLKAHPTYCAAKAGLVMLTQSLARELGPDIRVNGIAPGPVLWPEAELDPAQQAHIIDRTALKRVGSPMDIAKAAQFFIADAPYVTGQILPVDGGRTVGGF